MNVHKIRNSVVGRKLRKLRGMCEKRLLPAPTLAGLRESPPVVINSFPKSGTHLLYQLFENEKSLHDRGEFLASTPSLTMRVVPFHVMQARLRRVRPGELLRGHLFYDEQLDDILGSLGVIHYFIYRDPRDVVCSEAHYLATMNRWHRMHRRFEAATDAKSRIELAIDGIGNECKSPYYPDINIRYRRYQPWISDLRVCAIKFEDLAGPEQADEVRRIMSFYGKSKKWTPSELESQVEIGLSQINPSRSHTFRKGGGIRTWERHFDERLKERFKEVAGPLLIELGYERDLNW